MNYCPNCASDSVKQITEKMYSCEYCGSEMEMELQIVVKRDNHIVERLNDHIDLIIHLLKKQKEELIDDYDYAFHQRLIAYVETYKEDYKLRNFIKNVDEKILDK